jgi:hypothetical protein
MSVIDQPRAPRWSLHVILLTAPSVDAMGLLTHGGLVLHSLRTKMALTIR